MATPESDLIPKAFSKPSLIPSPPWIDAMLAANLFARNPARFGGIHVKAGAGAIRSVFLDIVQKALPAHMSRKLISANIAAAQLHPSIDITASLAAGRQCFQRGILQQVQNGLLVISMAERMPVSVAKQIAAAMDDRAQAIAVILLDESDFEEDGPAAALTDRCAFTVDLSGVSLHDAETAIELAPIDRRAPSTQISDTIRQSIVAVTQAIDPGSIRPALQVQEVARAHAIAMGRSLVEPEDVLVALRLALGITIPNEREEEAESPEQTPDNSDQSEAQQPPPPAPDERQTPDSADSKEQPVPSLEDLQDMLVEAAKAAKLELDVMNKARLEQVGGSAGEGKSGALQKKSTRGRPVGLSDRPPANASRPDIIATLRTAAPWQAFRRAQKGLAKWSVGDPLDVRKSDFRYRKFAHRTESTAIFAVDASGSTALERLSEAKGCIELLLADCYVRRDQVALIAFRGANAQTLLEPTRSLVRAKRSLTGMPGGGPTPLAHALEESIKIATAIKRKGQTPIMIIMTDGKGNVALNGSHDKAEARDDAQRMAKQVAALGIRSVIIDIARRPRDTARLLAQDMNADYCTLPRADATAMSNLVAGYLAPGKSA